MCRYTFAAHFIIRRTIVKSRDSATLLQVIQIAHEGYKFFNKTSKISNSLGKYIKLMSQMVCNFAFISFLPDLFAVSSIRPPRATICRTS